MKGRLQGTSPGRHGRPFISDLKETVMNRPTRALAALTSAAALTVAGMSPASAALWAHDDAVGDVESTTWNFKTDRESGPNAEPDNTDTDITRLSARHKPRRLVLRASLRDITADSGGMYYEIRTPGTRRPYYAMQRLGTSTELPAFRLYRGNGKIVRCTGVRRSVDRTTEQAVVSIPRRCLGRPRWVRVGGVAIKDVETKTSISWFLDDALRDGNAHPGNLGRSPRIQRG
jgi:hypothetical protein